MRIHARRLGWLSVAAVVAALGPASWGQRGGATQTAPTPIAPGIQQTNSAPSLGPALGADEAAAERSARMQQEQEKARNDDRQKKLVSDTERLLLLANELKTDVDKTNKDTMSLDVIRKAEEIERLAHSVKEKMKGT